ncbi:MAG TPA: hypothetical protein VM052_03410 [Candidatus Limnocylindrales bacterium]|nr:hypothetical protein [Candidatus Limnocylindrales bacterium]
MSRWMLRTEVEDELLDLEPLIRLDDRKRYLRGFLDLADLRVSGGQLSRLS